MPDLNDRRSAERILDAIEQRVARMIDRSVTEPRYGIVFGPPDTVQRHVAVSLYGRPEPSPGFVYGSVVPQEGDFVRVYITPRGDRFVDDVLERAAGPTGWSDLVLADAFETYAGLTPQVRLHDTGRVDLRGALQRVDGAGISGDPTVTTLSSIATPRRAMRFICAASRVGADLHVRIDLSTDGAVRVFTPVGYAPPWAGLDGITFDVR